MDTLTERIINNYFGADKRITRIINNICIADVSYMWYTTYKDYKSNNFNHFFRYNRKKYDTLFRIIKEKKWFSKTELTTLSLLMKSKEEDQLDLGIAIIRSQNTYKNK